MFMLYLSLYKPDFSYVRFCDGWMKMNVFPVVCAIEENFEQVCVLYMLQMANCVNGKKVKV